MQACFTHEAVKAKIVHALQQLEMSSKNSMGVALTFLTQYKEDGNDLLEQIITSDHSWIYFYHLERKSTSMVWIKKEEEMPKRFKNEQSTRQVMLTAFWNCHGLVYTEFSPDAHKEKQNITQDTYFDILMH